MVYMEVTAPFGQSTLVLGCFSVRWSTSDGIDHNVNEDVSTENVVEARE